MKRPDATNALALAALAFVLALAVGILMPAPQRETARQAGPSQFSPNPGDYVTLDPGTRQVPPWRCNLRGYRKDAATADFRAPGKESPGAIGPELLPRKADAQERELGGHGYDIFRIKKAVWALMCGGKNREPNSLAALGVLTALGGGNIPRFANKKEQARAVEALMNQHFDWGYSARGTACGPDTDPYRTVYADASTGRLKLGTTTTRAGRWSCYTALRFVYGSMVRLVNLRLECLQATATSPSSPSAGPGGWYTTSFEPKLLPERV